MNLNMIGGIWIRKFSMDFALWIIYGPFVTRTSVLAPNRKARLSLLWERRQHVPSGGIGGITPLQMKNFACFPPVQTLTW